MNSKTIIISSKNEGGRGILTFYIEDDLLKCKLRLYNVQKLNRYCKLGVYYKNEVFSANLIEREGVYFSSLVGDFNLNEDFYCAILDTNQNNKVILSGGTYAGFYFEDNSIFNEEEHTNDDEDDFNSKIELEDDCSLNCANCQYKKYFYENAHTEDDETITPKSENSTQIQTEEQEKINNTDEKSQNNSIINSILPQFDYIFKNFEENTELTKLIENSKFAKMEDGDYSLGAIYNDDKIKYICYAVKGNYNSTPPEELGEHYQWLPLDKEDPLTDGYYLVFQDAEDLKIVEV